MAHIPARHRLAAILSADAAGYSRLMAKDEKSTFSALQDARDAFRQAIESQGGRVVDTAGDSVLAIFETAIGAVSSALEVRNALNISTATVPVDRRLAFRIGLHLADVHELPDGSVYGDGVNVAARLQAIAEPGGIVLSDVVRSAIKGKVSVALEDAGEHHVKNIPEPVRVFRVASTGERVEPESTPSSPVSSGTDLPLPDKPSIAVLPFTNMAAEPEQEFFCDGISDDIITELSRFRSLFVIARNSSFTYRGSAVDVRTIARELGVQYVLEGGIRRSGTRIRLNAQLIDAQTGAHLWADKYDREVTEIFAIQEELTQRIVVAIAPFVEEAERQRVRRRPQDLSAYEMGVRATAKALQAYHTGDQRLISEAIDHAHAGLRIDPSSVASLVALAFCQWQRVVREPTSTANAVWQEGMSAAEAALESDRNDCMGYLQKAMLLAFAPHAERRDEALLHARRGYELNPNNMNALTVLAFTEAAAGHPTSAIERLQQVLRISPRDPMRYAVYMQLAIAHFLAGAYADGAQCAQLGIAEAPTNGILYGWLSLNRAGLGDLPRARLALADARKFAPGWVERVLAGGLVFRDPEQHGRVTSLLRTIAAAED